MSYFKLSTSLVHALFWIFLYSIFTLKSFKPLRNAKQCFNIPAFELRTTYKDRKCARVQHHTKLSNVYIITIASTGHSHQATWHTCCPAVNTGDATLIHSRKRSYTPLPLYTAYLEQGRVIVFVPASRRLSSAKFHSPTTQNLLQLSTCRNPVQALGPKAP